MTISRDEASALLSKLSTSAVNVLAVLRTRFAVFAFECSIVEVTPKTITLEQRCIDPSSGEPLLPYPSWFSLDQANEFAYGDSREVKPEDQPIFQHLPFGPVIGALTLYFSDTEALVLLEREADSVD